MAVSVSYASVSNKFSHKSQTSYRSPVIVNIIKPETMWGSQENSAETIDEVKIRNPAAEYYDGSKKLNLFKVLCSSLSKHEEACKSNINCGWCFSSNSCIQGNEQGAAEPCAQGHFMFRDKLK